jgi:hypothetical protein
VRVVRRALVIAVVTLAAASCATTGTIHGGRTALAPQEAAALAQAKEKTDAGFRRLWKSAALKNLGLLKWDQDHSGAAPGAPPALLQNIRDELGRLNQRPAKGEDLTLTVTVYGYHRGGWFSDPTAAYELVARDRKGRAVWVADDEVVGRPELAQTLVDSEEGVLAREITRKVRQEFGF